MEKTQTRSKSDYVYHEIRERILDGTYSPGYRLVLSALATDYEVSTVPVREAVRWLEAEGLVDYQHNVGAMVSRVDVHGYAESMTALAYLEGAATALAAPFTSEAALNRAAALNARMKAITQAETFDPVTYRKLNKEFHGILAASCENTRILSLLTAEADRVTMIRRSSFTFDTERSMNSIDQHDHLLKLIREGADPMEIELFARQHKLASLDRALTDIG
ncbi:MAG: GntR family transcriptional regulator [Actinomycetaceae bacterium]|nr:GntR family transcriptional regulator [Actinomycetaceae bacterium]